MLHKYSALLLCFFCVAIQATQYNTDPEKFYFKLYREIRSVLLKNDEPMPRSQAIKKGAHTNVTHNHNPALFALLNKKAPAAKS